MPSLEPHHAVIGTDTGDPYHPVTPEAKFPIERRAQNSTARRLRHRLRAQLLGRDGPNCSMCHKPLRFDAQSWENNHEDFATLDHILPRAHGGRLVLDNLRLACFPCNNARGCGPAIYASPTNRSGVP